MDMTADGKTKNIVIYIRDHLAMGGIEAYVYKQARILREKGTQIIWVKHPKALLDESFEEVFLDDKTLRWNRKIDVSYLKSVAMKEPCRISVVTFDISTFAQAEKFKGDFRLCPVNTFYFVPHFAGDTLYLEEAYRGKKKEKIRQIIAPVIRNMHDNGNILYFSAKHIAKMTESYGYTVDRPETYLVPSVIPENTVFNETRCRELATRERFNLMTASRFEFPHKGYLIGLIAAYGKLKKTYPRLELTIVGYGEGLPQVEAALEKLDEAARADVHMVGKVSPEELTARFSDANLNISVAGCCSQGARNGTLSIPARHYDYACEVYGYLPQSRAFVVSDQPGQPVIPFIEEVLNMSAEEYCARCKAGFDAFADGSDRLRPKMETMCNGSRGPVLTNEQIRWIQNQEHKRIAVSKCRAVKRICKALFAAK